VKNYWQIIEFFLQVAQKIDELSIDLGKGLFNKRGQSFKGKSYGHSRILCLLKVEVQSLLYVIQSTTNVILKLDSKNMIDDKEFKEEDKYESVSIILNFRSILSSYFHNS
jgi:hypothetical protein